MPYIDDIIIYSKTIDEHLEHIKEVFKRLKEVGFHLKLRKCEFFMEQMEFLGHTIDREGIRPNKDKIKAILDMPVPKTKTNVKSFLGLGSYYRRFIKNFAAQTHHMRFLTMEKTRMTWTKECQGEFEDIKRELVSDNIMTYPMLYRWSLKLAGYDYDVEYKKGEKHGNADGPSRNPVLNIDESNVEESEIIDPNETPLQRFWRLQNNDPWYKNLIRKVHTKGNLILDTSKETGDFEIKERELRKNDHEAWIVKEGTL
jgi:hypothetical protein